MNSSVFPVILAGGKGERFWPYSHRLRPKQLLPLTEERSMMEVAVDLARSLSNGNPIHLVIGSNLNESVQEVFANVQDVIIVAEPEGRDTCAAVALANRLIQQLDPQGVMVVLTADHLISTAVDFKQTLDVAIAQASLGESLVTLGIKPSRPETGFGYIELRAQGAAQSNRSYEVLRFVEKPDFERAQSYVTAGNYLWNSGMFIWRVDYAWQRLAESQPQIVQQFEKVGAIPTVNTTQFLSQFYGKLTKISVDFGLLEHAPKIHCVPVAFAWDDLGSWAALERIHPLDANGNLTVGSLAVDCHNTTVFSTGKPVVAWGLTDLLIAEVDGTTLVCPKDRIADLKQLLAEVRKMGREDLL